MLSTFSKGERMIKTIVFDIGNVLMHFDWKEYTEKRFGEDAKKINAAIWAKDCWDELDREVEDEEVVRQRMVKLAPEYKKEIYEALDNVGECMSKADYAIPWIQELKSRGYNCLFLSNYSGYLMDAAPDVLDFLPYMDGGVFSCDVGQIKPEYDIYYSLFEIYKVDPEECIFLDDKIENIHAAKDVGMQAIHFKNYEQAKEELETYLVTTTF